jgi:hypothetical protein
MTRHERGKAADERLNRELEESFPASDTPSILQRSPRGNGQIFGQPSRDRPVSETASTDELVVEHLSDDRAAHARVAPGWWALDSAGVPVLGPFPSHDAAAAALERRRK